MYYYIIIEILRTFSDAWKCGFVTLYPYKIRKMHFFEFFCKKFAKPKMFDVSLHRFPEMTKSQYGHVRDANVVRMGMTRFSYENVKLLNR